MTIETATRCDRTKSVISEGANIRPMLLQCQGLEAGYGGSQVLFGIDLEIRAGEVIGLLGRNGMGKSTTIKTIIGALKPQAGEVRFDNVLISGKAPDAIGRLGIAIVPEGRRCFPNLSVHEHLVAFSSNRNQVNSPWNVDQIYEMFPRLKERRRNLGNQLSGGEQQMLAVGRALSTNPRLLILDEATEGLAPVIREDIWRCLAMLREAGQTILVVDKYVHRLVGLADRHIILERGRAVWQGGSSELDRDRSLWANYLGV